MKLLGLFSSVMDQYAARSPDGTGAAQSRRKFDFFRENFLRCGSFEEAQIMCEANGLGEEADVEELCRRGDISHVVVRYDESKAVPFQIVARDCIERTVTLMSEFVFGTSQFYRKRPLSFDAARGLYWVGSDLRKRINSNEFTDRFGAEFVGHVVLTSHFTDGTEHNDSFFIPSSVEVGYAPEYYRRENGGALAFTPFEKCLRDDWACGHLRIRHGLDTLGFERYWLRDRCDKTDFDSFFVNEDGDIERFYRYNSFSGILPCCTIG